MDAPTNLSLKVRAHYEAALPLPDQYEYPTVVLRVCIGRTILDPVKTVIAEVW